MNGARGFSYVEVLVTMVIIGVLLVPGLEALHAGLGAQGKVAEVGSDDALLASRMESVLAMPLSTLAPLAGSATSPSSLSDAVGSSPRRLVYISRYDASNSDGDGNPFTGGDGSLLWIAVAVQDKPYSVATLVAP